MILGGILAAVAVSGGVSTGHASPDLPKKGSTVTGIAVAIDGDTLMMEDGLRVRLADVSAPEADNWPWGPRARAVLDRVIGTPDDPRGPVTCTVTGRSHKRAVARCVNGRGENLAAAVVRSGYGMSWRTYAYPDGPGGDLHLLDRAEIDARGLGRGVWSQQRQ